MVEKNRIGHSESQSQGGIFHFGALRDWRRNRL
jgi:hypothetical protein